MANFDRKITILNDIPKLNNFIQNELGNIEN